MWGGPKGKLGVTSNNNTNYSLVGFPSLLSHFATFVPSFLFLTSSEQKEAAEEEDGRHRHPRPYNHRRLHRSAHPHLLRPLLLPPRRCSSRFPNRTFSISISPLSRFPLSSSFLPRISTRYAPLLLFPCETARI